MTLRLTSTEEFFKALSEVDGPRSWAFSRGLAQVIGVKRAFGAVRWATLLLVSILLSAALCVMNLTGPGPATDGLLALCWAEKALSGVILGTFVGARRWVGALAYFSYVHFLTTMAFALPGSFLAPSRGGRVMALINVSAMIAILAIDLLAYYKKLIRRHLLLEE